MNKKYLGLLFLLTIFALNACNRTVSISDILNNPEQYAEQSIVIKGTVTESVNLLVVKYYAIDDGTGNIFVKTKKSVPSKGSEITVKGKVNQLLKLGQQQVTGLIEEERKSS